MAYTRQEKHFQQLSDQKWISFDNQKISTFCPRFSLKGTNGRKSHHKIRLANGTVSKTTSGTLQRNWMEYEGDSPERWDAVMNWTGQNTPSPPPPPSRKKSFSFFLIGSDNRRLTVQTEMPVLYDAAKSATLARNRDDSTIALLCNQLRKRDICNGEKNTKKSQRAISFIGPLGKMFIKLYSPPPTKSTFVH